MIKAIIFLIIIAAIALGILTYPLLIKWRRDRIKNKPFPNYWLSILENNLPPYYHLSNQQQKQLQGHIQVFIKEKQFIGCLKLQITEEMKITIAAIASLLLLNDRAEYFPRLSSILVYPTAYIVTETVMNENYFIEERKVAKLGESWTRDQLILSWEQIQQDIKNFKDGRNVILHEFAHQLDQEDGKADGVPILKTAIDYKIWGEVMREEYLKLCDNLERGNKTIIDEYGATNPAEFFAVVTEAFFEKPKQLKHKHQALYELLQNYYKLDPIQWL
jgi:MtfA peptidase